MAKETFSSLIDLFKSSSSSTVSTLACEICGTKLSVFRKKVSILFSMYYFLSVCACMFMPYKQFKYFTFNKHSLLLSETMS